MGGYVLAGWVALLGLATAAVIVSQKAQTASIIQALGTAASSTIGAAIAPVTGSGTGS